MYKLDFVLKLYLKSDYAFNDVPEHIKESIFNFIQAIPKSNTS